MFGKLKRFFLGKLYFLSKEEKHRIQELEKKMLRSEKSIHQIEHFKETMDKHNAEIMHKVKELKENLIKENEELKQILKEKDQEIEELKSKIKG